MKTEHRITRKLALLLGITALAVIGMFMIPAVPQDLAYHEFADRSRWFGVPNFWNVATNLSFLLIGLAALRELGHGMLPELRASYFSFFIGIALIALGSAYYHLTPNNATLVWDRLPMTVAFMAFVSIIVGEHLSRQAGRKLLWPLIFLGIASIVYWHLTEQSGHGDLRPYGLVQFLPMLLIPLILLLFPPSFTGTGYVWALLGFYGVAKLAELLDEPIFRVMYPISGHALKHVLAALGAYCFLVGLRRRKPV
ncbi:ceramidase domain-containing protein [Methylocaldum sp.]|uniref:ceramidase domain-containing protein n=1 Tax=Methylocaldum sp. TaxID=1969727 RepID=UPI002D3D00B0|nr:ceramidase domain-containing protein [Methylocaldum sp.]HYE33862.1 ceramidase domain-containing protein [Methylocaldum sp.]